MKKITFAVIFLAMAGWSGAQQVRLLGDEPADGTKASVDSSDMPQIIMPVEDTPAAEVKKATAPAAKKTVKPAAKKTAKKAAAPALAASTAAVSARQSPPPRRRFRPSKPVLNLNSSWTLRPVRRP